jgi:DNA-binding CsgD family transcriptional regulator
VVADELETAARRQRDRGAPGLAAELHDRAAELTPAADAADRGRRLLAAARCRFDSGDYAAADAAAAAVAGELTGDARAEALLTRAVIAYVVDGHPPSVALALEALAAVPADSRLAGRLHAHLSVFEDAPERSRHHGEAAAALLADSDGDRELLCGALLMIFHSEVRAGLPVRTELLDRALALEGDAPSWLAGTVPAIWWKGIDEHARAISRLRRHVEHALARGDEPLQHETLVHLGEAELLAGRWTAAAEHLAEARDLGEQLGTGLDEETMLLALLAAYRGELGAAGRATEAGLRRAEELDDPWGRRVYLGLAGLVALSAGRPAEAAEAYGRLAVAVAAQGLVEPLGQRFEADWIEACVGAGDLETAAAALDRLAERHERLPRPWTALGLARSRVLLAAATGADLAPALAELAAARAAMPAGVLPLDRARCLLVAGLAHRRARRKREAREALTAAAAEFGALGAAAFAARAEAELARVGVRASGPQELTATEERVARLAAQGQTNRVIADTLFVSPKTVEANLARVYRKLGISSRAELGAAMGTRPGERRTG